MTHTPAIAFAVALALPALGAGRPSAERAETVRAVSTDLDAAAAALDGGRADEAAALYRGALDAARSLGSADLLVARAADGLADVHRLAGRFGDAEPLYVEAARLLERSLGPAQPRLATTLHNLGVTRWRDGRPAAALPVLRRALSIWEAALGPDSAEARNTRRAIRAVVVAADRKQSRNPPE